MNDPTNTPCIVVADDESGTRSLLAKVLRRQGYEVLEATDGEEALSLAISRPVDLILCDLQMPRMRGEELGRWIDQLEPDLPVVLMTAFPGYESAVAAVRFHAADYLEKPFRSLDIVVDAVERALARRHAAVERRTRASSADERDRVDDIRRRFVSGVAHELRTPVTVIKSLTAVLARESHGPLTDDQREIVGHLDSETEALAHEIDKLLSLARVETADFAPDLEPVAIADVLRPVERTLRARAEERGIDLRIETSSAQIPVFADAQDIPRALLAIAENAVKFTGEGGTVTVRATADAVGVTFEVADTGIGIAPQDQARIFELFAQADNPLTRRYGGCGVGLAFAARIVEAHGGRIELRSRLGEGTTFRFRLPHAPEMSTTSCTIEVRSGGAGRA